MKNLLVSIFACLALVSCSDDDKGSGGGLGGNGGGAPEAPASATGQNITGASSQLAQDLAGNIWCSDVQYFDEKDTNNENPQTLAVSFFDTGKFSQQYIDNKTGQPAQAFEGQWGASADVVTITVGGEVENVKLVFDKPNNKFEIVSPDGNETFNLCGQL